MNSMLLNLWTKFREWVSVKWSALTFYIVFSVLGVCILALLLNFLKTNYNKGKSIKWGRIVLIVLLGGIMGLLAYARFA